MSASVSTMTAKTKIKIVFLGGQSVGKSSIIEKYIHDRFDESSNVRSCLSSPPSVLIFWLKTLPTKAKAIAYSFGILQDNKDFVLLFPAISKMQTAHLLYLM
jgi:GTPase SAR1 family protein